MYQVQIAGSRSGTWVSVSDAGRPRLSGVREISRSVREIADASVEGATESKYATMPSVKKLQRN